MSAAREYLEEAVDSALQEEGVVPSPAVVEVIVGAVGDWLETVATEDKITDEAWATKTPPLTPGRPPGRLGDYWSVRTLAGLAAMVRRRA